MAFGTASGIASGLARGLGKSLGGGDVPEAQSARQRNFDEDSINITVGSGLGLDQILKTKAPVESGGSGQALRGFLGFPNPTNDLGFGLGSSRDSINDFTGDIDQPIKSAGAGGFSFNIVGLVALGAIAFLVIQ